MKVSNSRRLSLEALLTALAVVLNLAISFPAPYLTFLTYEVWEVPIVLALLILGLRSGVTVAALNSIVLELVKAGLPAGPIYNFAAIVAITDYDDSVLELISPVYLREKLRLKDGSAVAPTIEYYLSR